MHLYFTKPLRCTVQPFTKTQFPPHFHAKYSGQEALFNFDGELLEGELPKRAIKFVREWISFHKTELEVNRENARTGQPLNDIEPLE